MVRKVFAGMVVVVWRDMVTRTSPISMMMLRQLGKMLALTKVIVVKKT